MKNIIYILISIFLISTEMNAQIDRSKQPKPGPAPKISLEKPKEFQLPNGMKVLVVENHKLPRVLYNLIIDKQPVVEGNKKGTADLLGSMLGNGTTSISKDKFNEEVDFLGASMGFGESGGYARGLSKYADRVLELLSDAVKNPLLTEKEFQKEKEKQINAIKSNEKNAKVIAGRVSRALSFGKQFPYGEFVTEETLNNITLSDVKNYYNNYFSPDKAYFIVVGDVDYHKIKKQLTRHFGKWKNPGTKNAVLPKEASNVSRTEIDFVDLPQAVQSSISLTNNIDLKMSDPDYFPVLIANKILGGGFNSYLNMNLREKHGYTYGASSVVDVDKYASRFYTGTSVRNAVTDSAVVETLKEVNRIIKEPVSAEDLKNAKAKFTGDFVLALEKPITIARYAIDIKTNNLPEDFYTTYLKKINAVTAADVKRVANKYFKTGNARIIVVGKGSDVLTNLEKTGIPIKYFDKYANPVKKPEFNVALPAGVTTKTVLENYIKAIGGRAKLDKVKSILLKADAEIQPGVMMNLEMKKARNNKFSQVITAMGSVMSKQVVDGDTGYMEAQGQKKELSKDELSKIRSEAGLFPEIAYLDRNLKLEKIDKINGEDAYKIKVSDEVSAYYSVKTGLRVKDERAAGGMVANTFYSDYRDVNGIKFPFKITQEVGPQKFEFIIKEMKLNEGVSDADFK